MIISHIFAQGNHSKKLNFIGQKHIDISSYIDIVFFRTKRNIHENIRVNK